MTMRKFQKPTFEKGAIEDVPKFASDFKTRGYTFVNVNATTCEGYCEVLYAFRAPGSPDGLTGIVVDVPDGSHVLSITQWFPEAFVFENEAHDLFGISFDGISIDYGGEFYTLSLAYPMNPRAAAAREIDDAPSEGAGTEDRQ